MGPKSGQGHTEAGVVASLRPGPIQAHPQGPALCLGDLICWKGLAKPEPKAATTSCSKHNLGHPGADSLALSFI